MAEHLTCLINWKFHFSADDMNFCNVNIKFLRFESEQTVKVSFPFSWGFNLTVTALFEYLKSRYKIRSKKFFLVFMPYLKLK